MGVDPASILNFEDHTDITYIHSIYIYIIHYYTAYFAMICCRKNEFPFRFPIMVLYMVYIC